MTYGLFRVSVLLVLEDGVDPKFQLVLLGLS